MPVAPIGPLPLTGHWRGPDNTEQLGRGSAVATTHNLSFIPHFFLRRRRWRPLEICDMHWHVFQMCFSLGLRVWITGGQEKQTVVLLFCLHGGLACRILMKPVNSDYWYVTSYTESKLFPKKSEGHCKHPGCAREMSYLDKARVTGRLFTLHGLISWGKRAWRCLRSQGLGSALKEILTNRSKCWKKLIYSSPLFLRVSPWNLKRDQYLQRTLSRGRFIWSTVYFVKWEGFQRNWEARWGWVRRSNL